MSWEAIRALPLCKARLNANGKVASLYIPGEDLEVAEAFHPPIWRSHHPSEPSVFDVYQAAAEARALLEEHDRAVELLRQVGNSRDELWESGHDELFENIGAFLRGSEAK